VAELLLAPKNLAILTDPTSGNPATLGIASLLMEVGTIYQPVPDVSLSKVWDKSQPSDLPQIDAFLALGYRLCQNGIIYQPAPDVSLSEVQDK